MGQSIISEQVNLFLYALILGLILGAYYDIFRFLREIGLNSTPAVIVEDLFYCTSISIPIFLFFTAFNSGNIRIFALIGMLIGTLGYRFTIGILTLKLLRLLLKPIRATINLIKKPFHIFSIFITKKYYTMKNQHRVKKDKKKKTTSQNNKKPTKKKTKIKQSQSKASSTS